jgi:uncharacterized membrane protein YhaH (DUF805 family)
LSRGDYAKVYLGFGTSVWLLYFLALSVEGNRPDLGPFGYLWVLLTVFNVPLFICAGIGRLHDIGKSGNMLYLAFVPIGNVVMFFYLLFARGAKPGATRWG